MANDPNELFHIEDGDDDMWIVDFKEDQLTFNISHCHIVNVCQITLSEEDVKELVNSLTNWLNRQ